MLSKSFHAARLSDYPLVRVLVPYAAGIAMGYEAYESLSPYLSLLFCIATIALAGLFVAGHKHGPFVRQYGFGLLLSVCAFFLGTVHCISTNHQNHTAWSGDECGYRGIVVSTPQRRGNVWQVVFRLTDEETHGTWHKKSNTLQLSLYDTVPSTTSLLRPGCALVFRGKIEAPHSRKNPGETDYAAYLYRQGVEGTCFLPVHRATVLPSLVAERLCTTRLSFFESFKTKALLLRQRLLGQYDRFLPQGQEQAVLAALTLGDKHQLTSSTRQLYSHSGASHLLALSGLHLGLLYGFLLLLFSGLRRWPAAHRLSVVFTLCTIWAYVFLTGMPVSLERAALMYSFLSLALLIRRNTRPLHILSLAAFSLLLLNPLNLFDVGFQLSFLSVFFILWCVPLFTPKKWYKHPIGLRLGQFFVVACCAQIGVAPWVAYHFHTFPSYFLLTNLIAVPLTYLVMGTDLLFFLAAVSEPLQHLLGQCLQVELTFLHKALSCICRLPGSGLSLAPSFLTVVLVYVATVCTVLWWQHKRRLYAFIGVLCLALIPLSQEVQRQRIFAHATVWFYDNGKCPSVHFIADRAHNFLWNPPSIPTGAPCSTPLMPAPTLRYWERHGLHPKKAPADIDTSWFRLHKRTVLFGGHTFVLLYDTAPFAAVTAAPLCVDYLFVCRGFKGHMTDIARTLRPRQVILDASLSPYYRDRFLKESKVLGWPTHSIRESGALKVSL